VDIPGFTGDPTGVLTAGATIGAYFTAADSNVGKSYNSGAVTIAVNTKATGDNVVNLTAGDVTYTVWYLEVTT